MEAGEIELLDRGETPGFIPALRGGSGEETLRAVVGVVVDAQREYLERGNTKPFASLLLSEAEIQAGRARAPGSFDVSFSKRELDDINQWAALHDGQSSSDEPLFVREGASANSIVLEPWTGEVRRAPR